MFHDVFLPVIRDHLRTQLSLDKSQCNKTINRQVLQHHGEKFVNLYPGSSSDGPSSDQQHGVEQYNGFYVGITFRTGKTPRDRLDKLIFDKMLPLQRHIVIVLKRDRYEIAKKINDKLGEDGAVPSEWKLVEPFRQIGDTSDVVRAGPDHFGAATESKNATRQHDTESQYGLFMELEYGRGRFMARLPSSGTASELPLII